MNNKIPHGKLIDYSIKNNQSIYETISGLKMNRLKYDGKNIIEINKLYTPIDEEINKNMKAIGIYKFYLTDEGFNFLNKHYDEMIEQSTTNKLKNLMIEDKLKHLDINNKIITCTLLEIMDYNRLLFNINCNYIMFNKFEFIKES